MTSAGFLSIRNSLKYFINRSYLNRGERKKEVFNSDDIFPMVDKKRR